MKVKVAKVKVKVETKLKDVEVWEMNYKEKLVLIKGKAKLETEGNIEQMWKYRNGSEFLVWMLEILQVLSWKEFLTY